MNASGMIRNIGIIYLIHTLKWGLSATARLFASDALRIGLGGSLNQIMGFLCGCGAGRVLRISRIALGVADACAYPKAARVLFGFGCLGLPSE